MAPLLLLCTALAPCALRESPAAAPPAATAPQQASPSDALTGPPSRHEAEELLPRRAPDVWFPAFHIRPPQGHVNDPNGPMYDPRHKMYHLFFQWCRDWPCHPGPGGKGWGHYASRDLVTWTDVGYAVSSDGVGCPDFVGVFSGSASLLADGGGPILSFPGVHNLTDFDGTVTPTACEGQRELDGDCMSMCTATPTDAADPLLRNWTAKEIIRNQPKSMNWRFLDPSQMWRSESDGRWWMFTGGSDDNETKGISMLYSTSDPRAGAWQLEHSLHNFTAGNTPCKFVSCPEMFSLEGMGSAAPDSYATGLHVYVAACAGNLYWLGNYSDTTKTLQLEESGGTGCGGSPGSGPFSVDNGGCNVLVYGNNHACKSMWDAHTARRIMWCWIRSEGEQKMLDLSWNGMQSVPREIAYDRARRKLRTTPVKELELLRTDGGRPLASVVGGTSLPIDGGTIAFDGLGQQLDINASFALPAVCVGAHPRQSLGVRVMVDPVAKTSAAVSLQFAERGGGAQIPPYNVSAVVWVDMTQSGSNATKGRTQAPLDLAAAVGSSSSSSGVGLLGEQEDAVARFPLRILVDRSVIEVYAQDGITVLSALMFPPSSRNSGVELFAENMGCEVDVTAQIFGMGSAYAPAVGADGGSGGAGHGR
jgi:sucrose-6-phosphate hydrolase SacC (GH32 family)